MYKTLSSGLYVHLLLRLFIAGAIVFSGSRILADDGATHGSMEIQYSQDSSETRDKFIYLDAGITSKTSLRVNAGNSSSPAIAGGIDLDYWGIGVAHRWNNIFDSGLVFSSYGQGKQIKIDSIEARLQWSSSNWAFSIKPQLKQIELFITGPNRTVKANGTGAGLTLAYYGIKNWEYSLSYTAYHYTRDLSRLATLPRLIAKLSAKALTGASALRDSSASVDITCQFPLTDIYLSYGQSKSAIDKTTSSITSTGITLYQLDPFKIGFEAGSVSSVVDTASYYGGFTLGYLW